MNEEVRERVKRKEEIEGEKEKKEKKKKKVIFFFFFQAEDGIRDKGM